jgi:hypothetical protein
MNALRRWFGPSREDVWRELSTQIGASYVDGGFWKGDKVQASHGEWTITLDSYAVHANKTHVHYTRLRAPYVNPGGFRFRIYRRGLFSDLGSFFGMQDVEVGHEPFDRDFVIKGTSEPQLKELFSSAQLRELLTRQPGGRLEVKDDEGWFGPRFPDGVDELSFTVRGVVKDLDRLKEMYELFAEALDELCRIGAAYDTAPGVQL